MEKSVFSERLAMALEKKGMRQTDLCKKTGINKATISQYMSGKYTAKHDRAVVLAQALECNPLWLEGYDVDMEAGSGDGEDGDEAGDTLPVFGLAVGEDKRLSRERAEGREYARREWCDRQHFYIVMPDNSMEPIIHKGDLLLCEECRQTGSGQIGLFIVNGSEICVRRYVVRRNGIALVSENPIWTEYFFANSASDLQSQGSRGFITEAKVIQCTHRFI